LSHSEAYLSDDRRYRYWLLRIWDDALPVMANIGANPSTADETVNDPTIRKDIGFATRLGFGGLLKLNVGGFRATKPKDWYNAADPFGPENSIAHLLEYLATFDFKFQFRNYWHSRWRYEFRCVPKSTALRLHLHVGPFMFRIWSQQFLRDK
jgi:hypothetical protein